MMSWAKFNVAATGLAAIVVALAICALVVAGILGRGCRVSRRWKWRLIRRRITGRQRCSIRRRRSCRPWEQGAGDEMGDLQGTFRGDLFGEPVPQRISDIKPGAFQWLSFTCAGCRAVTSTAWEFQTWRRSRCSGCRARRSRRRF